MFSKNRVTSFWNRVVVRGKDDCWIWTGGLATGYGVMRIHCKNVGAHRYSWMLHNNESTIPKGLWILHKCDNRKCVNPKHLYCGTPSDNMSDREARIQWEKNTNGLIKLNPDKVREIRSLYKSEECNIVDLAKRFGVSGDHIVRVANHIAWASVS